MIFGRADVPFFPFHEGILLMGDPAGYIFYSDTKRWEKGLPEVAPDTKIDVAK